VSNATLEAPSKHALEDGGQLVRHTKRPEWGVGILAWDQGDTRAYQFEDGRMRKFRKGFFELIEPIEEFEGPEKTVRTNLRRAMSTSDGDSSRKVLKKVCAFEDQLQYFLGQYPGGFQDEQWQTEHRSHANGPPLKRHRDPTVSDARDALSAERCGALVEGGREHAITDSAIDVLAATNLVPISHVNELRGFDDDKRKEYGAAVAEMLHGDEPFDDRFGAYLRTISRLLGGRPSWRVATALPAIVYPQEHVSVRRSAFARQAGSIAPTAEYSRRARVPSYKNFRRVALGVKKRLEAAGQEPSDMLDIHDFIWTTLRSSALAHMAAA